ncbi:MAG: hypothetical protein M5U12_34060 [Verrucomicrobia bacterium]|nr:hypothetical protein [Verrucomicrobiota bacterium]
MAALSAPGNLARYRFGSNLDGLSDAAEGNLVFNHWPDTVFSPDYFDFLLPNELNFFHGLVAGGHISLRGNSLVNNLPFPASRTRLDGGVPGAWLTNYYAGVLADPAAGVFPTIAANSTARRLRGTVPLADATGFPVTVVDIYLADPVGLATGEAVQVPELPHGFVQGRTYLRSFVENSPADLEPVPGRFDFDLAALGLTEAVLTITANYASAAVTTPTTVVVTGPFSDPMRVTGGPVDELRFTAITRSPGACSLNGPVGARCRRRRVPPTVGRTYRGPPARTWFRPAKRSASSACGGDAAGQNRLALVARPAFSSGRNTSCMLIASTFTVSWASPGWVPNSRWAASPPWPGPRWRPTRPRLSCSPRTRTTSASSGRWPCVSCARRSSA